MQTKYEILTDQGFKPFHGVRKQTKQIMALLELEFDHLQCTPDHKVLTEDGFKEVQHLTLKDKVKTLVGFQQVECLELEHVEVDVYDPLEVCDTHSYISNNIVSHNCEFLGTGDTYIDGSILSTLDKRVEKPLYRTYNNRMYVWEDPIPTAEYIIATDPSLGRERDNAAFVVFNAYTGNLAAEFYSNTTPINELAEVLNLMGQRYNFALICPERNNIGHLLIEHLFERLEYENLWFDVKNQPGEQITQKNRETMLAEMEEAIRMEKIKINSKRIVSELNTFIVKDSGKPEADKNQHDDLVMSLALAVFVRNRRYGDLTLEFVSNAESWKEQEKEEIKRKATYHRMQDVAGRVVEEDITWLLKK